MWYALGEPHLPLVDSGTFWPIALINLAVGNGIMVALNVLAAVRGHGRHAVPFALLQPLYWVLHSFAAWRALVQLIRRPFYWEKTPHGLDQGHGQAATRPQPELADVLGGRGQPVPG